MTTITRKEKVIILMALFDMGKMLASIISRSFNKGILDDDEKRNAIENTCNIQAVIAKILEVTPDDLRLAFRVSEGTDVDENTPSAHTTNNQSKEEIIDEYGFDPIEGIDDFLRGS